MYFDCFEKYIISIKTITVNYDVNPKIEVNLRVATVAYYKNL